MSPELYESLTLRVFENLLQESLSREIRKAYPNLKSLFDLVSDNVPAPYFTWTALQLIRHVESRLNRSASTTTKEELQKLWGGLDDQLVVIMAAVTRFDYAKKRNKLPVELRDINRFENVAILARTLNNLPRDKEPPKIRKIYDDASWLLLVPENRAASCKYGKGTKWCISGDNDNLFDEYSSTGDQFLFAFDKKRKTKFAFSLNAITNEFDIWDEQNELVTAPEAVPDERIRNRILRHFGFV